MPRGKYRQVFWKCSECNNQNYRGSFNEKTFKPEDMKRMKFCPTCNKHTEHTPTKQIKHTNK